FVRGDALRWLLRVLRPGTAAAARFARVRCDLRVGDRCQLRRPGMGFWYGAILAAADHDLAGRHERRAAAAGAVGPRPAARVGDDLRNRARVCNAGPGTDP